VLKNLTGITAVRQLCCVRSYLALLFPLYDSPIPTNGTSRKLRVYYTLLLYSIRVQHTTFEYTVYTAQYGNRIYVCTGFLFHLYNRSTYADAVICYDLWETEGKIISISFASDSMYEFHLAHLPYTVYIRAIFSTRFVHEYSISIRTFHHRKCITYIHYTVPSTTTQQRWQAMFSHSILSSRSI
jgi:hypothetical protein